MPLSPNVELQWPYQYKFATERGAAGCDKYGHGSQQTRLAEGFAMLELR
jgi:hypothetical protein